MPDTTAGPLTLFDGDRCPACGGPIERAETGRPAIFCSHACRQAAYRGVTKLEVAQSSTPSLSAAAPEPPAPSRVDLVAIAAGIPTPVDDVYGPCRAYCECREGGHGVVFGRDAGRVHEPVGPVFARPRQAIDLAELLNTRLITA